jgi:hypothetical protein
MDVNANKSIQAISVYLVHQISKEEKCSNDEALLKLLSSMTYELLQNKENGLYAEIPEYRNRGLAQKAIQLEEAKHGNSDWELDTILQEEGNCHLYEKMGYRQTGKTEVINDKMTLVVYRKD